MKNVSKKENYNIKELLTSTNTKVPALIECEILKVSVKQNVGVKFKFKDITL